MSIKELFGHAIGVVKFGDIAKFYNWFTKRDHTLKGDITFEGGVDLSGATVVEYTAYASENAAIDAGLVPGDKFLLSGVVTTVTKIKQEISFVATQSNAVGFLVDMSSVTPDDFYNTYFSDGTLTMAGRNSSGVAINFDSLFIAFPGLNTITAFVVGSGYFMTSSVTKTITIYGKPVNPSYKLNIINGVNHIAWVDATTTSATALANYSGTKSNIQTKVGGATVNDPANFERGKSYQFSCNATTAVQNLPKTSGVGDPTVDTAFATLALATAGGVEVGQVWYNTTSKRLLTRMS